MRVIPLQPHPLLFQVNLEPKMNTTDSKEAVNRRICCKRTAFRSQSLNTDVSGTDERRFVAWRAERFGG
jgi:hypothetical protein